MAKTRTEYQCQDCGAASRQWAGQCVTCGAWNTLVEAVIADVKPAAGRGYAGQLPTRAKLGEISATALHRLPSGMGELDRVLGGGFVPGSVVLLGGAPGAGKSTPVVASRDPSERSDALSVRDWRRVVGTNRPACAALGAVWGATGLCFRDSGGSH